MRDPGDTPQTHAAKALAINLSRALGVDVDPKRLKAFIRDEWNFVRVMAHSIHGSDPEPIEKPKFSPGIVTADHTALVADNDGTLWWIEPMSNVIKRAEAR